MKNKSTVLKVQKGEKSMGYINDSEQEIIDLAEVVPPNSGKNKRILGIRPRNWIEGLIECVIFDGIMFLIPFVPKLKMILFLVLTFFILLFNAVGYRDKTWIELLLQWIKYKASKKCYRLRSPSDDIGKNRIKQTTENPYLKKITSYFDDSNLEVEEPDTKRIIAKLAKDMFRNITDNFNLFDS